MRARTESTEDLVAALFARHQGVTKPPPGVTKPLGGRPALGEQPMTPAQRKAASRARKRADS